MAFEKVVRGEDYTPGVEIQLTLIRLVNSMSPDNGHMKISMI